VPHVGAALRDVLAALGGAVTRPNSIGGGFHVLLLGDVLNHERFRTCIPEDTRFHFKVLHQDPRGLLRNPRSRVGFRATRISIRLTL
jgi:hypothetical protein